ncbi:flagellar basal-body rod protein FlgB [Thermosyntropha lipolytica DSM 11003]|uniref:Flagellar basal body rod protein FlgB n=1 Tax=Thermosyntropha lipolytica DSM 11003 TaxID=1123382 RepID=A0A1M5L0Q8_9FIRM|nr:flagellar basal body rod protein FlgB [Thermosyntropha lipolytica]SHG58576.1 flagellar basal-body rod protein FlgB [Thermosyntropha lipolytica DSM 11003]
MLDRIFNSTSLKLLQHAMDVAELRQKVIADNIANVDTPGFKKSEVVFEQKLKEFLQDNKGREMPLKTTNARHIKEDGGMAVDSLQPEIKRLNTQTFRNDGNNVDIDVEMAEMSKNKIMYDALAQSITNELRLLRIAISGRRQG